MDTEFYDNVYKSYPQEKKTGKKYVMLSMAMGDFLLLKKFFPVHAQILFFCKGYNYMKLWYSLAGILRFNFIFSQFK